MDFIEKTLNSQVVYDGKIITVLKDDVEVADGHKSFREVVKHSGGVVILAIKQNSYLSSHCHSEHQNQSSFAYPQDDRCEESHSNENSAITNDESVLFVKQFRYPMKEVLLELPAGKLEYGEDPFLAAQRELEEETGYCADKWTDLGFVYTSPGYSDEKLYLYKAENLHFTQCHPDEGEILQPLEINIDDAIKMINNGEINDAKTLCAFFRANIISTHLPKDVLSHNREEG